MKAPGKKLGQPYTIRGMLDVNETNRRIQLFDGRFDTAFRVESFSVMANNPLLTHEFFVVVSTDELAVVNQCDFADNAQIAWATWNAPSGYTPSHVNFIDPDNLVVEDLYLTNLGSTDATFINYIITMQKYEISEWKGALSMVRNRSQG